MNEENTTQPEVSENAAVSASATPISNAATVSAPEQAPVSNPTISIDDFIKIQMKTGKILSAEKVEGSPKLLKLSVDFGEAAPRQVLSGIAKSFQPEDLIGKTVAFVTNLAPRQIMGQESQAMILAASDENGLALFAPTREMKAGSELG